MADIIRATPGGRAGADDADLIELARTMSAARRGMDPAFDPALFVNPGWEMMLDLYAAGPSGRPVPDAIAAAGVGQTVALRWLTYLKGAGMAVERGVPDPDCGRATVICLTDHVRAAFTRYLRQLIDRPAAGEAPFPAPAWRVAFWSGRPHV